MKAHHYSGSVVGNSKLHFGVFLDGQLHGVMSYGPSMNKQQMIGLVEGTGWNEFMELNRMAFDSVLPRNSESRAIAMSIRLLKDCFAEEEVNELLVACYAIGWSVSEEDLEQYPHLRFASGEDDTGVIISFNSEAESVTDSLMIPEGTKTFAINPLNGKTDSTPADKSLNLGDFPLGRA